MACMEHICRMCDKLILNNTPHRDMKKCPRCGATAWISTCDEDQDFKKQAREERMEHRDRRTNDRD